MPSKKTVGLLWEILIECIVVALSNRRLTNVDGVIENNLQRSRPNNSNNNSTRVH
jgi:hypothetical protein